MKKNQPLVSIVLPTYNGSKYIQQSIESCLNQTYKNIELIIVDDCSIDETPKIIKSYKDRRIRYIRHEKNKGLPTALNTGFSKASGNYLTWTSDDNFYNKESIEKMLSYIQEKNCSFVYCDMFRFIDDNTSNLHRIHLQDQLALDYENGVGACFLYTKDVKEEIGGYNPETVLAEDYDYWIRVSKKFKMCHLSELLYYYRVHEKSLFSKYARFGDIKIASILVRSKHDIIDIKKAMVPFISSILTIQMKRDRHYFIRLMLGFFMKYQLKQIENWYLFRVIITKIYSHQIQFIIKTLKDYQVGKIDYNRAKTFLKECLTQRKLI